MSRRPSVCREERRQGRTSSVLASVNWPGTTSAPALRLRAATTVLWPTGCVSGMQKSLSDDSCRYWAWKSFGQQLLAWASIAGRRWWAMWRLAERRAVASLACSAFPAETRQGDAKRMCACWASVRRSRRNHGNGEEKKQNRRTEAPLFQPRAIRQSLQGYRSQIHFKLLFHILHGIDALD